MKIAKGHIFNLMDTNGRRNDVTNAIQGYLTILNDIQNNKKMTWAALPASLAQYEFYRQAIERSPEVFQQHRPFDQLTEKLKSYPDFLDAVTREDCNWIRNNTASYCPILKLFDKGIEDRARHYTTNLVKLGFADGQREISPVGELLLNLDKLKKDSLESMLPIDGVNIIYLRQLLKLRIFDANEKRYYSPFHMALFVLLTKPRVSETDFLELVQGFSPYSDFEDIENYIAGYKAGQITDKIEIKIPEAIRQKEKLPKDLFKEYFKNRKSGRTVEIYWEFYEALWEYAEKQTPDNLNKLLLCYEENKAILNKAFGKGLNIFRQKTGDRPSVNDFYKKYKKMFGADRNEYLYVCFMQSKNLDQIREYSDTTKRIFKASGIIRFDSGFAELAYRELCTCIFEKSKIRKYISGNTEDESHASYDGYGEYEVGVNSYFCKVTTLSEIFDYSQQEITQAKENIKTKFPGIAFEKIPDIIADKRKTEFAGFVERTYPQNKVKEILLLFTDRKNDNKIKEIVSPDATVPTIYEYMVGIAWYYFSGKRIDLLESFNLTLSANFEPLVHAGGGQGDIVIYEEDKVVMLEATLMNANSQKRGEWEPVLRHSINLKAEEEKAQTGREVTSFFIADKFDFNTINIWKAVASVPLQSTVDKDKLTENVVIMPVSTEELCSLMDKEQEYDRIITDVHKLFEVDKSKFDIHWRDKFMESII